MRENEGEAAEYGIYFDDTEYDYMQHLRSVGEVPDGILLEAPSTSKGKGKAKEVIFGEKVQICLRGRADGSLGCRRRCYLARKREGINLRVCRISQIV